MPNPVLDALKAQVEKNTAVEASAVILINGIKDRLDAAVAAALANSATQEELQPVTDEIAALSSSATSLADAVAANT